MATSSRQEAVKDAQFQAAEAKKKWKMSRFRPPMDLMRAKLQLGINPALELREISMEEVHKRFVTKNTMVMIKYVYSLF